MLRCTRVVNPHRRGSDRPGRDVLLRLVVLLLTAGLALTACGSRNLTGTGGIFQGRQAAPPPPSGVIAAPPGTLNASPLDEPQSLNPGQAPGGSGRPDVRGVRVGLLLPLSGQNATLGQALLDAAQLALFDVGGQAFTLLPRDTGGTPEGAAAAARSAIAEGARIILGPLFAAEVGPVVQEARAANVNVVSFSNDRAATANGAFILGLPPQVQIDRVVGFARSRGLTRFAALVPGNAFGAVVEDALRNAVTATGGETTTVERYDPGATDAAPSVRRLGDYEGRRGQLAEQRRTLAAKTDQASRDALRALEGHETAGDLAFEAVLLPDSGDRLLTIAPLLPYYDIDPARARFLGMAAWDDPRLAREPALVGAWFAAPPPDSRADFMRRFRATYGREAPRVATVAYDAVALASVLAQSPGGPDFSVRAIATPSGFDGLDGLFRLLPDGMIERGLAVLEIQRTGTRVISPAPKSFDELVR
jgi:ABC-type branched-subunit amino acid transport system substrate-binding protein